MRFYRLLPIQEWLNGDRELKSLVLKTHQQTDQYGRSIPPLSNEISRRKAELADVIRALGAVEQSKDAFALRRGDGKAGRVVFNEDCELRVDVSSRIIIHCRSNGNWS